MNFAINQPHSINDDNMFVWWDMKPCFVIYANSLGRNFLLLQFALFENIKLLGQTSSLFTASE